ncbi:DUF4249 domain-containing protein [Bacteroidota bacterium]
MELMIFHNIIQSGLGLLINKVLMKSMPFAILLLLTTCEFPYEANINEETGLISIDGSIVKGDAIQTITISRSTSLFEPDFEPLGECIVQVLDEDGNMFDFHETKKNSGIYQSIIADDQLFFDRGYKVRIITPDEKTYESEYETILRGAPVDSVYYEKEFVNIGFENQDRGLKFYLDLKGAETDSRYYRWKLTETWEYKSVAVIDFIYLNKYFHTSVPEDPLGMFQCWKTLVVPGLYSSSTVNLTNNEKKKIPLHFISPSTGRISIKYSLLIEQFSLTPRAYDYWHQNKIESEETGGLYTQQPGQVESNLFNIADEEEHVLGYFWAAAKTEKRIFVDPQPDLNFVNSECEFHILDKYEIVRFPVYVFTDDYGNEFTTANQTCMNCLLKGGVNERPAFWE